MHYNGEDWKHDSRWYRLQVCEIWTARWKMLKMKKESQGSHTIFMNIFILYFSCYNILENLPISYVNSDLPLGLKCLLQNKNHRNAVEGSANTLCFTQLYFYFFSNPHGLTNGRILRYIEAAHCLKKGKQNWKCREYES